MNLQFRPGGTGGSLQEARGAESRRRDIPKTPGLAAPDCRTPERCSSRTHSRRPRRRRGALAPGRRRQDAPDSERSAAGGRRPAGTHRPRAPQLPSPPRSVHPLPPALGAARGAPRSPRADPVGGGPRSPGRTATENSQEPKSGVSDGRSTCAPHRFGFGGSYSHFAIFIPRARPRAQWAGVRRPHSFLRTQRPASQPASARKPRPT